MSRLVVIFALQRARVWEHTLLVFFRQLADWVFVFKELYFGFPREKAYPSTLSEKENGFPLWGTRLLTCTSIIARLLLLVQTPTSPSGHDHTPRGQPPRRNPRRYCSVYTACQLRPLSQKYQTEKSQQSDHPR